MVLNFVVQLYFNAYLVQWSVKAVVLIPVTLIRKIINVSLTCVVNPGPSVYYSCEGTPDTVVGSYLNAVVAMILAAGLPTFVD